MDEEPDIVLIDIRENDLTLGQILRKVSEYQADSKFKDFEIFLDGDAQAIVARRRY